MYRIGEEEAEAVRRVILSKQLFREGDPKSGHQQETIRFEDEWAGIIGTKYALCLSGGGTAALACALAGMGIGPGDEVIVPAYTWLATPLAALMVGAIPVIVDVDESLGLDPEELERKITPETRAVIPVHLMGRPANLDSILGISQKHGLKVLEDCCQAIGGSYRGRRLGSWGDAGAFSFNQYKIISCGEGGALVTDDDTLFQNALVYHDSGANFRCYASELTVPVFVAQQYRASELMSAVLRVQTRRLDGILADLRRVHGRFREALSGAGGVRLTPNNDLEGDCAVVFALQFDNEARARTFAASPGVGGSLPIDSDKHVYINWEPLLQKRIGHRPDMSPFNHPRNQKLRTTYTRDMCLRTLDILGRTVFISLNPDWSDDVIDRRIHACREAAAA